MQRSFSTGVLPPTTLPSAAQPMLRRTEQHNSRNNKRNRDPSLRDEAVPSGIFFSDFLFNPSHYPPSSSFSSSSSSYPTPYLRLHTNPSLADESIDTSPSPTPKKAKRDALPTRTLNRNETLGEGKEEVISKPKRSNKHNKYALVIGNNAYSSKGGFDPLKCCINDATSMKGVLEEKGYHVTMHTDVKTKTDLITHIDKFLAPIGQQSAVLFYYAGHAEEGHKEKDGVVNVGNALVPTSQPSSRVSLQSIQAKIEAKKLSSMGFFLDACRSRGEGSRAAAKNGRKSAGSWTVPPFHQTNVFYSFGCSSGQYCLERSGEANGLFTKHLIDELRVNTDLNKVLRSVCKKVSDASDGEQRPWYNESICSPTFRL